MPITRSWDQGLFDTRLGAIVKGASNRPSFFEKVVERKSSDDTAQVGKDPTSVRTHLVEGFGPMKQSYETERFQEDSAIRGGTKVTSYNKYALAVKYSEEIIDDDLTGICEIMAKGLGESDRLLRNLLVARLFDNGNATTYFTSADGKAIFATDHTSYGGGATRANILGGNGTINGSLSYTTAGDMFLLGKLQTDNRGYANPSFDDQSSITLLIQPRDEMIAQKLFGPGAQYQPSTEYAQPSYWANKKIEIVSTPYLSATSAAGRPWFMLDKNNMDLWMVDRKPLQSSVWMENNNKSWVHDVRARWALHVFGWEHSYGGGF